MLLSLWNLLPTQSSSRDVSVASTTTFVSSVVACSDFRWESCLLSFDFCWKSARRSNRREYSCRWTDRFVPFDPWAWGIVVRVSSLRDGLLTVEKIVSMESLGDSNWSPSRFNAVSRNCFDAAMFEFRWFPRNKIENTQRKQSRSHRFSKRYKFGCYALHLFWYLAYRARVWCSGRKSFGDRHLLLVGQNEIQQRETLR